ncbi:MAG: hypothetical protein ACK46X_12665, partial [Candidatus Sericytochromatia bacterium]
EQLSEDFSPESVAMIAANLEGAVLSEGGDLELGYREAQRNNANPDIPADELARVREFEARMLGLA